MSTASDPGGAARPDDVPWSVTTAAAGHLAALAEHERELFALRLQRWWPDLHDGLAPVYAERADELAARLVGLAAAAYAVRDGELKTLDLRRTLEPDWFQHPRVLGYATYADRFAGNLVGVRSHIGYLTELGVTYLHLMPLLQPRPGPSDGGYAVADYRSVRTDLGTVEDLRDLAAALRRNGISLCMDLVLNHVAREHAWAQAARDGDEHYRRYFRIYPDRTEPDAFERTLPEVFPDFAPGSFSWDEALGAWVWTTFNTWQWDVDWSNPDVFAEYADVILFLANLGVEVLRLDAIAFIWKRLGTNCQNQPEVHSITQALRALTRIACPAVIFKAEAIVAPSDLVHYLGQGAHHGKVSDLAYHNSLMVQLWSMLASQDVRLATHALQAIAPVPASTAWITYARCHDDIGWAIDDRDAEAVGLNGWAHRAFLSDFYAGQFPGSFARGLVFQHNEITGDRRISGSLAALSGLDAARAGATAPDQPAAGPSGGDGAGDAGTLDRAVARILLAHALVLGWGGVPVVWMGDELGLPNDEHWADDPEHADDNRWVHRPAMDWAVAARRHESGTVESRVFAGVRHLARVRAGTAQLDASVAAEALEPTDPGVFVVRRRHPVGAFVGLYNVTPTWRPFPAYRLDGLSLPLGHGDVVERIHGGEPTVGGDGNLWLPPYAAWWLTTRDG